MSKATKIWLIVAASLVLLGCIIFGGFMTMLKWNFTWFSTNQHETNHHEIHEKFKSISIVSNTADIVLVPSERFDYSVECYEQKNLKHSVTVKDDTLVIEVVDTRKWYEHVGFNFRTPKITVSIPQGEYGAFTLKSSTGDVQIPKDFLFTSMDISQSTGDVTNHASALEGIKIKTTTGNICVENLTAGSLDLSVSTGKITVSDASCQGDVQIGVSTGKATLTDMTCKNLRSNGDTGDLSLRNVIATESFSIERSTGDVTFEGCDAAEIFIKTDTGDIWGSLLTDKVFITKTDTGHVNVPNSITGGRCEITTDTGDITVSVR